MFKYRTVDTQTLAGLKTAERLHRSGWKMIRVGFFSIQFEKRIERKIKTTKGE